jgi:hypothetical protein
MTDGSAAHAVFENKSEPIKAPTPAAMP